MTATRLAYSVAEAARVSNYSPHLIRKAIREQVLRAYRPAGKGDLRIFDEDLRAWIRGDEMPLKPRKAGPCVSCASEA